jgi:hypothetical protein
MRDGCLSSEIVTGRRGSGHLASHLCIETTRSQVPFETPTGAHLEQTDTLRSTPHSFSNRQAIRIQFYTVTCSRQLQKRRRNDLSPFEAHRSRAGQLQSPSTQLSASKHIEITACQRPWHSGYARTDHRKASQAQQLPSTDALPSPAGRNHLTEPEPTNHSETKRFRGRQTQAVGISYFYPANDRRSILVVTDWQWPVSWPANREGDIRTRLPYP